jgi:hypothetical protein
VFVVAIVTKKHFLNKCLFSCHKEKKKKYRCLAFHSLFYRGFGCDNHVTDSLILLESVREYLQPFVILALQCCRSFSYNSFFAGSFSDTTHVEVQALVRVCHPWGPVVTGRCLHFPCVHPYLSKLVDCFMKIGAVVPFLITYSSCYLRLVQKFLIGCLSFMSIRVATIVVFSSLLHITCTFQLSLSSMIGPKILYCLTISIAFGPGSTFSLGRS